LLQRKRILLQRKNIHVTTQLADLVHHRGEELELAEVDGEPPFDPARHSLSAVAWSSACWQGYRCIYAVDDELRLEALHIRFAPQQMKLVRRGEGPLLFDHRPRAIRDDLGARALYELRAPLLYTGALLVGTGALAPGALVPPGYQYARVRELAFAAGRLLYSVDATAEMERRRAAWEQRPPYPPAPPISDERASLEWIRRARETHDDLARFFAKGRVGP
jgi:hypothetical protein